MGKIFYDIIPPKAINVKTKPKNFNKSIFKIAAFGLIVGISWTGISSINKTRAYLSDVEKSEMNFITAGALDFQLSSTQVFSNLILSPGASATGTISIINLYNVPKYKVKAVNFTGVLCDYLYLEANLDGGAIEYSGKLKDIDFGPTVFDSPDDWFFILTLPASTTESLIGETCNFNFEFYGSQTKNNLPFGQGFSDIEDATSSIKAKMCFDSEIRSCGYWKDHPSVYKPYLPQLLGNEVIDTVLKAENVLKVSCGSCGFNCDDTMRTKLKGQLLAMKFNVAHYGIGDYIPTSTASSVSQIITEADNLLKATSTPDSDLEEMKDLLESLAQDLPIRVCTETGVKVLIPNGGEKWWVGKYYDLTWVTKNLNCPDGLAQISIWYSSDSGNTWGNIIASTTDDGVLNWRIPLYLENNTYYTPSDKARIKVVAVCSENLMVAGWDMSDYDFCPPIERDLLTPEELELAISLGLIEEEAIAEESTTTEEIVQATSSEQVFGGGFFITEGSDPASDIAGGLSQTAVAETTAAIVEISTTTDQISTSTEEISTTTEQVLPVAEETSTVAEETPTTTEQISTSTEAISTTTEGQNEGGIINEMDNIIDNIVDEIIDILTLKSTTSETVVVPESTTTTEVTGTTTIEQAPILSEQPVIIPENNPTEPTPPTDDPSSGGEGTSE